MADTGLAEPDGERVLRGVGVGALLVAVAVGRGVGVDVFAATVAVGLAAVIVGFGVVFAVATVVGVAGAGEGVFPATVVVGFRVGPTGTHAHVFGSMVPLQSEVMDFCSHPFGTL